MRITGFLVALFLLLCPVVQARELALAKMPWHYAAEMERFYQKPRPEIIPRLLLSFNQNGWLDDSGHRLVLAAFLAELIRKGTFNPYQNRDQRLAQERNITHVLAWANHLAGNDEPLASLNERDLAQQIMAAPKDLAAWNIDRDVAIPQMRLAAFFASGNIAHIDALIASALGSGKNANLSAALLYDSAPRHQAIVDRLRLQSPPKGTIASGRLDAILGNALKTQSK